MAWIFNPNKQYKLATPRLGWSTKFRCREISRNIYFVFREIIFFISRNFAKFRIAKYYEISEISRNFCEKIKIFTG
jgi:hypothetical protein